MNAIRVFLVDDHPLMRNALEMAIEAAYDMQVVGEAANGAEALEMIPLINPDIVLMDLMMPEINGLVAIRALTKSHPEIRILVLSSVEKEAEIVEALQSGALGYVTKSAQRDELLQAIRTVWAGEAYLPPKIATKVINTVRNGGIEVDKPATSKPITVRQKDVLKLLGQGFSNKHIAEELHIAEATVRVHISHMMDTLGFDNRRELVVYAVKETINSQHQND